MANTPRVASETDLDEVAAQLGEVKLFPVAKDDHLDLRAIAKFAIRKFNAGDFTVHVGLREALLRLEHPAFEASEPYEESLGAHNFEESTEKGTKTSTSGEVGASFDWRFFLAKLRVSGKASAARDIRHERKSLSRYKIIAAEPGDTWRIGSELGDPRQATTGPPAVAYCLDGAYLDRPLTSEPGTRADDPNTLCRLDPKPRGPDTSNDERIIGELTCAPRSLFVALERPGATTPGIRAHDSDQEKDLREGIIDACLQREASNERSRSVADRKLAGEFRLHRDIKFAPKLALSLVPCGAKVPEQETDDES
jgi:hypothetical protein